MGIKEKIGKTISDKDIKKPLNMGNLLVILSPDESEIEDPQAEMIFCPRCDKKTESNSNDKDIKFCKLCGTKRNPV